MTLRILNPDLSNCILFWIFWSVFPPRRPPKPWPFKSEVEGHTIHLLQTTSFYWTFGLARFVYFKCAGMMWTWNQKIKGSKRGSRESWPGTNLSLLHRSKIVLHVETLTASRGHMFLCIMCCVTGDHEYIYHSCFTTWHSISLSIMRSHKTLHGFHKTANYKDCSKKNTLFFTAVRLQLKCDWPIAIYMENI